MSIQQISPNNVAVNSEYEKLQVKVDHVISAPQVSQNDQKAALPAKSEPVAIHAQEVSQTMKQVTMLYDLHGKVHISYMDKHGTVIYQTPSEMSVEMDKTK